MLLGQRSSTFVNSKPKRRWIPAEIPQRKEESIPFDPLNYLVKYSLIHKERLGVYERIFQQHVANQKYKYHDQFTKVFGIEPPRREKTFIKDFVEEEDEADDEDQDEPFVSDDEDLPPDGEEEMNDTAMAALDSEEEKSAAAATEKKTKKKRKSISKKGGKRGKRGKKPTAVIVELSDHEKGMIRDLTLISRAHTFLRPPAGTSDTDTHLARVQFTMRTLQKKLVVYQRHVQQLSEERKRLLVEAAKASISGIRYTEYEPSGAGKKKKKTAKKDKKKKKKKSGEVKFVDDGFDSGSKEKKQDELEEELSDIEFLQPPPTLGLPDLEPRRKEKKLPPVGEVSDDVVYQRLEDDDELMGMLEEDYLINKLNIEIERMLEKIEETKERIQETSAEEKRLLAYTSEVYIHGETEAQHTSGFRRAQSATFNRLNPAADYELNMSEMETALREVNSCLINEQEMQFIYHVLDLPGTRRINFKLFAVIAAMSEKVAQLDPVVRKLLNKFDFEALQVKIEKSKELFQLLHDSDPTAPDGQINVESLIVELTAGGLSPENIQYIVSKVNRERRGLVDLMDFMTFVPLFVEIHERIVTDPFSRERTF